MINRKITMLMLLVGFGMCGISYASEFDKEDVVYKLYKDFAWTALFDDVNTVVVRHQGKSLVAQPYSVLQGYFDKPLALLIEREEKCREREGSVVCRLAFNPLFGIEDVAVAGLKIYSTEDNCIVAEYQYPSNGEYIRIKFKMVEEDTGWKIEDIKYRKSEGGELSLKDILKNNHYIPGDYQ